jgi:protein N-terminal methyltransferase
MKKLSKNLNKGGYICLKENISQNGFIFDVEDSSITRTDEHFKFLLEESGLDLKFEQFQIKFPTYLFKVKMYATQPKE